MYSEIQWWHWRKTSQWHHIKKYDQACGNMQNMADGCEHEDVEEETTALGSDARTVRKLTGETRHTKHPGCYGNCNGRKEGGINSTKHMGASPTMPVNREMQSDRRVK